MTLRAIALGLVVVAVWPGAAGARALQRLDVRRAVLDADRRLVVLDLRCRASRVACTGVLRAISYDGAPITTGKRVRLARDRTRRVALRLRADGLRRFAESTSEALFTASLTTRKQELVGDAVLKARLTCRSGDTLAASTGVRVFRLEGLGVYVCRRPAGRPRLLTTEDVSLVVWRVDAVKIAEPFVAFTMSVQHEAPLS
jgi:hypothetical protein